MIDLSIPIMDLVQAIVAILTALFVVQELRKSANTTSGEFLLNLQEQYATSEGFALLFDMCWKYRCGDVYEIDLRKHIEKNRAVLLNYFTFFESIYLMVKKRSLHMNELDELFGRRFLSVVNNKIVQEMDLVCNHDYYTNIYELYSRWKKYRKNGELFLMQDNGEFDERYRDLEESYRLYNSSCEFMKDITIRVLGGKEREESDRRALDTLVAEIEKTNNNKLFWLPISDESRDHFLDSDWTIFMGAFRQDKLIGALGLFLNENEYGESRDAIGLEGKIAEYGRAMVHPDYRGYGLINHLAEGLLPIAKEKGIESLIATVHPENIPSSSFLIRMGFEKCGHIMKNNVYPRDILVKKLD